MAGSKWALAAWLGLAAARAWAGDLGAAAPPWAADIEAQRAALDEQAKAWESMPGALDAVKVPERPLRQGARGADAALLCEALAARGFGDCGASSSFDGAMGGRVRAAQESYGLQADGLAGPQLYEALALAPAAKARLARESSADLGRLLADPEAAAAPKAIVVNVASYRLRAYGPQGLEIDSRAIVGRPDRRTPLGTIHVVGLKLNPDWTPPATVLRKDLYPSLDGDGEWIRRHGVAMFGKDGQEVPMEGVGSAEAKAMGYRFSQRAGAGAALGRLKFETDSSQDIYLHDTSERGLFALAERAKSSGCVRVQRWEELAAWVWGKSEKQLEQQLAAGGARWIKVAKAPVFIGYRRAEVEGGKVVIYPDVYRQGQDLAGE